MRRRKSTCTVGGTIVTGGGELQNCQFQQQFLKMYKSLVTLHTNGCDFLGLFEHTFTKKHSVFGDQTSLSMSAAHFNMARNCLSAVVPQTARFASKQMQTGVAEKRAATEKGDKKMVGKDNQKK